VLRPVGGPHRPRPEAEGCSPTAPSTAPPGVGRDRVIVRGPSWSEAIRLDRRAAQDAHASSSTPPLAIICTKAQVVARGGHAGPRRPEIVGRRLLAHVDQAGSARPTQRGLCRTPRRAARALRLRQAETAGVVHLQRAPNSPRLPGNTPKRWPDAALDHAASAHRWPGLYSQVVPGW